MSTPKFTHDCTSCEFQGHFMGNDVYLCLRGRASRSTIIARYGDDGPDYSSNDITTLRRILQPGERIGGAVKGGSMLYLEWLFSDEGSRSTAAMLCALAERQIDELARVQ